MKNTISYQVETITFGDIFRDYPLDTIGLVKIDIEGGEENILVDIVSIAQSVPVMLSFIYHGGPNQKKIYLLLHKML